MNVFVLIREDQNQYGYIDTAITGVFHDEQMARRQEQAERAKARAEGYIVEDDDSPDGGWEVSWMIEEHLVG